jgi:hypothetical protein
LACSTNEKAKYIFYWWKPPDDMLLHEINNMLNKDNVLKLASVDFSTEATMGRDVLATCSLLMAHEKRTKTD